MNTLLNTVAGLMTESPVLIKPGDPIEVAESLMRYKHVRHWPVTSGHSLVGILSLRELLGAHRREMEEQGSSPLRRCSAGQLMSDVCVVGHPNDPVVSAAEKMNRHRLSCLPVVEDGNVVGVVTLDHVVAFAIRLMKERESHVGYPTIVARLMTCAPLATVQVLERVDVAQAIMGHHFVRHLPVMRADRLVGIVSERDIAEVLSSSLEAASSIVVGEVMSARPITTSPEAEGAEAGMTLVKAQIGALPVVREELLLGILSKSDFLSWVVERARANDA
jgi:CBS domain-containing membrane protein